MSNTVTVEQAAAGLSELVRALGPDDEIVVTENDRPIARIIPETSPPKRVAGVWKNQLEIISDDDEHLEDFKDYM